MEQHPDRVGPSHPDGLRDAAQEVDVLRCSIIWRLFTAKGGLSAPPQNSCKSTNRCKACVTKLLVAYTYLRRENCPELQKKRSGDATTAKKPKSVTNIKW